MSDFQSKYTGSDVDAKLDKVKDMIGASSSHEGVGGLVPKPEAGGSRFIP